jgi:hypothetical protein
MKIKTHIKVITLSALTFAFSTQAHDPKEHMKEAQEPDCAAIKDMDHSKMDKDIDRSKMDMDDPVMQAIMKKCMKHMDHDKSENKQSSDDPQSDKEGSEEQNPEDHPE